MPLLPIDLQTLFSQTPQVGKEQAAQKDGALQAQSLQGALIVAKNEQQDNDVNRTPDPDEGAERVKDGALGGGERRRRKAAPKRPAAVPARVLDVVRDPALGRNIDVSG